MDEGSSNKKLIIRNESERIVMGEVYIPMHLDSFNTTMTKDEIKRVAYDFMRKGLLDHIDEMHNYQKSGSYVVESFIARTGDPDFVEGSWVLATKIENDEVWGKVVRGEYNGYSIGGRSTREKAIVKLTRVQDMELKTERSIDSEMEPHDHKVHLIFDRDGKLIPTWTSRELDHEHEVIYTTATGIAKNHNHRFVVVE